jgi:hypothetical protein
MGGGSSSKARLDRVADAMRGYVERGETAGVVALVSRRDEIHVETLGVQDLGSVSRRGDGCHPDDPAHDDERE